MNITSLRRQLPFWSRWAMVLVVAAAGISGCVTNPATGETEFSLISRAEEIQIGTEGDAQIVAEFGLYGDQAVATYVNDLGQKLARTSDDPNLVWTFRVLDSPVVNAFALPGGFVYVTRGLLAHTQSEAQLAVVIGHEIGHVTARHTARRITQSNLVGLGVGIGSIAFPEVEPFLGAISQGLQLLFLKFSRADETQSDDLGVKYATRAGYQGRAGSAFFTTLSRLSAATEGEGGSIPEWASTHPDPARRQEAILEYAAKYKAEISPNTELTGDNPEDFLPKLDNLVVGQDPRQGYHQGGVFYHPQLRFQFNIPSGWQIGNFPTQVQLASPGQDPEAGVVMTIAADGDPRAAATTFASQNGIQALTSVENVTVNGLTAARVQTRITLTDEAGAATGTLTALSYFIRKGVPAQTGQSSALFVFHGYSTDANFAKYQANFLSIFNSFAEVTNPAVINIQPFLLDIFKAPTTNVFSALVNGNTNAGFTVEDLAIMNQVETGTQITSGTSLKRVP